MNNIFPNNLHNKQGNQSILSLSIIMPCYKGEDFIENSINIVEKEVSLFNNNFEIVVVIDGEIDSSQKKAKALEKKFDNLKVVSYAKNRGKGFAIKYGLQYCEGEYIAFLDSDLDYHPKALSLFLSIMENEDADLVIGNRRDNNSIVKFPFIRKISSLVFSFYINALFPKLRIYDTQAGIKLINKSCAEKLFGYFGNQKESDGFIYDIYLLISARELGLKIIQVPCIYQMNSSTIGTGKNFLKAAFKMGNEVFKFKKKFYKEVIVPPAKPEA